MDIIKVHLGDRSYDILVGEKLLTRLGTELMRRKLGNNAIAVILTVPVVKKLLAKGLEKSLRQAGVPFRFIIVPDTERSKSFVQYGKVLTRLTQMAKGGKSLFLINLGGGVVGDLGGFAAATFKRGIPYVHIPTTLLAQVDSAIGGKVGIDLPIAKNMAGAFWQPRLVVSDVSVLKSLPRRQFLSGLAEVIKYGVIQEPELFHFLERSAPENLQQDTKSLITLVKTCSQCKARFVEQDERDQKGRRALLNFGHTIGHAIEAATDYSKLYTHGEAISIGMICAARIATDLGLADSEVLLRLTRLLGKFSLPARLGPRVKIQAILRSYLYDKKFTRSRNRFVLPTRIGRAVLHEGIPEIVIRRSLAACLS